VPCSLAHKRVMLRTSRAYAAGAERLICRSEGSPRGEAPAPRAAGRAFLLAPGGANRFCLCGGQQPSVTCCPMLPCVRCACCGHMGRQRKLQCPACLCSFGSPSFSSSSPSSSCRRCIHSSLGSSDSAHTSSGLAHMHRSLGQRTDSSKSVSGSSADSLSEVSHSSSLSSSCMHVV
jgi:hypothetical protein